MQGRIAKFGADAWTRVASLAGIATLLAGCASSGGYDGPSFSLPASVASITEPAEEGPKGSATELYGRIATGANTCWFGSAGPLKKDYIYHAEADAPSRGGKAEIVVHQRDPSAQNPRGPKVYRIAITPKDEASATIATENLKMSEEHAAAMASDVDRWAKGDQGCKGSSTAVGWAAETPAAAPAAPAKSKAPAKKAPAASSSAKKASPVR